MQNSASGSPLRGDPPQAPQQPPQPVWIQALGIMAWPLTIFLLAMFVEFGPRSGGLLRNFIGRVTKVEVAGVKMEISQELANKIHDHFRGSFDALMSDARRKYDRMADLNDINQHLERAISKALPRVLREQGIDEDVGKIRATVHVPDIVFADYLYQLVDYYPVRQNAAGRRFSQRFGIIGRSWRLRESLGEGNAMAIASGVRTLVEQWGMTSAEAQAQSRARPAYLSIILRGAGDDDFPIGVLFVDSEKKNAFGEGDTALTVANALEKVAEVSSLAKALAKGIEALRPAAPRIDV